MSRSDPAPKVVCPRDSDQRAPAIEHLDFAIAEFRDMKMQQALGVGGC
jgi:hypothetical protein